MTATPGAHGESRRALFKGTAILLLARFLSLIMGFLQTVLVALYYGATSATDAFFVASAVPIIFLGVVESNLGLTFTPLFIEMEEAGDKKGAWTLATTMLKRGGLLVLSYSILTMVLAVPLAHVLAPGFSPEDHQKLARLIFCLAPQAIFVFVSSTLAALCFIRGVFLLPAVMFLVADVLPCLCMVTLHRYLHIYALPLGLVSGSALGCLVLYLHFGRAHPLFATPADLRHPAIKRLGQLMAVRTATTSLMQVNLAVDRVFASHIGAGHVAHLAYAQQLIVAVRRLFIVPVGRSVMPHMSRAASRQDFGQVRTLVESTTAFLGFAIIPLFVLLIGFPHQFVQLMFAHGAFDEAAVRDTARALVFYTFGAFSAVLNPVLTASLFALKDSLSPLKTVAMAVVLNAVMDYLFIQMFSFGGIALATSVVTTIVSVTLWMTLRRKTGGLNALKTLGSLGRTVLASLGMLAVAKGVEYGLRGQDYLVQPVRLFLACAVGGVAYLMAQAALNRQEFQRAVTTVREFLVRRRQRRAARAAGGEPVA